VTARTTQIARKTHLSKTTFARCVILSPLIDKHRITHGVCPEFPVPFDFFRRLFHVTASLMAVIVYRSVLFSNSGKHMGSYHMPPRLNALIPFSILSIFFIPAPRLDIRVISLPATLRRVNGEAHRVSPVLFVDLHVLGFLFHGHISLHVLWSPGLSVDDISPGLHEGVFPEHSLFFSEQADPGVGINPTWICCVDSGHHGFVPPGLCSRSLNII
jgi:hypothetical protein